MKKSLYLVLLISTSIYSSDDDYRSPKSGRPTISTAEQKRLQAIYCPDNSIKEDKVDTNNFGSLSLDSEDPFVALRQQENNKQPSKKAQKRERKKAAATIALQQAVPKQLTNQLKPDVFTPEKQRALVYPKRDFRNEGYGRGKGQGVRGRRKNSQECSGVSRRIKTLADLIPHLYEDEKQQTKSTKKPNASIDRQQERPVCLDRKEEYNRYNKQTTVNPLFNQDFPSISPQQGLGKYAQEHRETVEDERQAKEYQQIKKLEEEAKRELAEQERETNLRINLQNTAFFPVYHLSHFGYGGGD